MAKQRRTVECQLNTNAVEINSLLGAYVPKDNIEQIKNSGGNMINIYGNNNSVLQDIEKGNIDMSLNNIVADKTQQYALKTGSNPQARKIDSKKIEKLQEALLAAFPNPDELKMMVDIAISTNIEEIAKEGNLKVRTYELITWSITNGRIVELINGAKDTNKTNKQTIANDKCRRLSELIVFLYRKALLNHR